MTNKFSHWFLCAVCRQRGGEMAAKEEAVEKEKRIGEVKIERKEEHPLRRTKIDGARDIDSYTHNIYTQNATFKFIFVSFQNGLAGKATLKKKKTFKRCTTLRRLSENREDFKNQKSLKSRRCKNSEDINPNTIKKEENKEDEVVFDIILLLVLAYNIKNKYFLRFWSR